jgi:AraC-like DNA-binding protein
MLQMRMDHVLNEVNNFADEAVFSPGIARLFAASRDEISPLMLNDARRDLGRLQIRKDQVEDFYIYFPALDLVVSRDTYNDSLNFFEIYISQSSFTYPQWLGFIKEADRKIKLADFSSMSPLGSKGYIMLVRPISFVRRGSTYGNIVFLFRRENFIPPENSQESRNLFIVDRISEKVIYFSSGAYTAGDFENGLPLMNDDKKNILVSVDSRISDWRYVMIGSKDRYLGKVIFIRFVFIFCLIFSFIISMIYIIFIVKRNWNSLNTAIQIVDETGQEFSSPSSNAASNEYQIFSDRIFYLQKEKYKMDGRLKYQQALLQSQVILGLIENSSETRNMTKTDLESYGINFKHDIFLVLLVFDEKNSGDFFPGILQVIFSKDGASVFPFHMGKYFGLVINQTGADEEKIYGDILKNITDIDQNEGIKNNSEIVCTCSNIFYSYTDLNKAYMQASDVMGFKNRAGYKNLVFYRDIAEFVSSQKDFELYKMAELYVKKAYTGKILNVEGTANALGVSTVRLSRVFKKYGGVCLSDYINILRIEHSKSMLGSDTTLACIADTVGFGSFRTFMRVFKKHEGLTPGQYKSIHGGAPS